MTTTYDGTPPGLTGTHYGGPGLGVLGSAVPSTGYSGPAYLYPALEFSGDANVQWRGVITRFPTNGTLTVYEDSSFEYSGTADYFEFRLYGDGDPNVTDIGYGAGISRYTLAFSTGGQLSGTFNLSDIVTSGDMTGGTPSSMSGTVALDDIFVSGVFGSQIGPSVLETVRLNSRIALTPTSLSDELGEDYVGELYLGDNSTIIELDTGADLSLASSVSIMVKDPAGAVTEWAAEVDGTLVTHILQADEIPIPGRWRLQAKVITNDGQWLGKTAYITVYEPFA